MNLQTILEQERSRIGEKIGVSSWHTLDQERISAFADVTGDHQFIHVDPDSASKTPFGGTIAHGFLTLSLCATMAPEAIKPLPGQLMFINYGFEKARFLTPVPAGKAIRAHFTLQDVKLRSETQLLHTLGLEVELEGSEKPAIVATWLSLAVFG